MIVLAWIVMILLAISWPVELLLARRARRRRLQAPRVLDMAENRRLLRLVGKDHDPDR